MKAEIGESVAFPLATKQATLTYSCVTVAQGGKSACRCLVQVLSGDKKGSCMFSKNDSYPNLPCCLL